LEFPTTSSVLGPGHRNGEPPPAHALEVPPLIAKMLPSTQTAASARGVSTLSQADRLHFTERGSGPPLLLVHGLLVTGEMFEPVLELFARRHRVIVPDLRGHGRSRALPPPYTVVQLAADLALLLQHLGIASARVLGYSQGGAVAQQFALDHPGRCERLVLACTYAFNMTSLREKVEGRLVPLLLRILGMDRFAKLVIGQGLKEVSAARRDALIAVMGSQDRALMSSAWRAAMAFDSRPRLSEIRCPTLVLAGADDTAVPRHHADLLHAGIADTALSVVEGAGHALIWTHPDELVRRSESFFAP
jgi:pimeloyl-ACP methyl ester carboxylesterase